MKLLMVFLVLLAAAPAFAALEGRVAIVEEGDTLWDIAGTYYKDPFQWYRIYREPRNNIKDPDLIFAGHKLYIPNPQD